MGNAQIYIISNGVKKNRIKNLIDVLKEIDEIEMELNKFYPDIMDIYDMVDGLSKNIGRNVIRFIVLE